jgi:small membrane protein
MLIQILLVVAMALALVVTWRRARQNVITVLEAIGWSVIWIAAAVVVLLPKVTTRIAEFVGVGRGVDLVLYASVATLFLLVFKLFIQHEKLERQLTDVVRHEALRDVDRQSLDVNRESLIVNPQSSDDKRSTINALRA